MNCGMNSHIICALDTSSLDDARKTVSKLKDHVVAFKIGHALTLNHSLAAIGHLRDAGAERVFLDLKFHDIPHSVGLAVGEATKDGAWMMTIHTSGGAGMMRAAAEQVSRLGAGNRPLIVGVSVLTSLTQADLTDDLGCRRTIEEQMVYLSKLGIECGLDGSVCSPHEAATLRAVLPTSAKIVTPGIRLPDGNTHDQARAADPASAVKAGADYLVIGRPLSEAADPVAVAEKINALTA